MVDWELITWATVVPLLSLMALVALWLTRILKRGQFLIETTENFITARHQVSLAAVSWSFFSGALGSWVFVAPASYATYAGLIGLSFYAVSTGLPLVLVGFLGNRIQSKFPHVSSSGEFVGLRFGSLSEIVFIVFMVFNMSIAMLAEYTTMASLFKDYVGTQDIPIVVVIGVLSLLYTTVGGTLISIVTDQFQGFFTVAVSIVLFAYVGAHFNSTLSTPMSSDLTGLNIIGYSSILTLPVSLTVGTVFSEAVWQKCWASSDSHTLHMGSLIGCCLTILIVFGLGFLGFLAGWGNLIDYDNTNPNLYMFQSLDGSGQLSSWIGLVTIIGASMTSQSAVDSIQNGLMGVFSSYWLKQYPLAYTRVLVVLINVPLIVIGFQGYNVLSLFLVANMLCTCAAVPFALGLSKRLESWYTGDMVLFSVLLSLVCTSVYGVTVNGGDFQYGMWFTWYGNGYLWDYFAVALGTSIAGPFVCMFLGWAICRAFGWEKIRGVSYWFERLLGERKKPLVSEEEEHEVVMKEVQHKEGEFEETA